MFRLKEICLGILVELGFILLILVVGFLIGWGILTLLY